MLAHPGGPFWAKRDAGAWSIPKGLPERQPDSLNDADEELLAAARREFEEETGLHPAGPFQELGEVRQKAGKVIHAWACEGDADPASLKSNETRAELPYGSGRWITFPEVDRYLWCDPQTAREKLNPAQAEFVDRLEAVLLSA